MKLNLLLTLLLFSSLSLFGQTKDYNIRLVNSTFLPQENLKNLDQAFYQNSVPDFLLLQFYDVPNTAARTTLEECGITLGDYIPNYAYVAKIDKGLNVNDLIDLGVRSIVQLDERFKYSPDIFQKRYPEEAIEGDKIRLLVNYYKGLDHEEVKKQLATKGRILSNVYEGPWLKMEVAINDLPSLAQQKLVQYIEPLLPEVDEATYWITQGRTNWLNSGVNGFNYAGEGYTLAVKEGGTVNPNEHVEFKGRFAEANTGSTSGHKTGVGLRIASAGNKAPRNRSIAYEADLLAQSNNSNYESNFASINLRSVNHSYGFGIGTSGWSAGTTWDGQVRNGTGPVHTWSAGNVGGSTSNYGTYNGITGYNTLTGGSKQAKNTFAVGSTNTTDSKTGFSSTGPAYDGRVKPDLMVEGGGGTSHAAPKMSGIVGQMCEAYMGVTGNDPHLSLIKALLLNTCDDLENVGPDFRTGYGRVNVRRAYKAIDENRYIEGSLSNGGSNNHQIIVPANVKELRVLVHWADYPAASSLPAVALVNNLDLSLIDPSNSTTLPWVLDHTPNVVNLAAPATRGVDNLNNVEQVTITNPATGTYTIKVDGTLIPQGPQTYYVTYEFLYDELTLTSPIGGEHLVPGESEYIYWDSYGGTGTFDLEYSIDNGASWMSIASGVSASQRYYNWTVPDHTSGQVLVRVKRGVLTSTSIQAFNIMDEVTGLQALWSCSQSVLLSWDAHPDATAYRVTKLGAKYMEEIGTTSDLFFIVNGVSATDAEWFSVQAIGEDDALSIRALAIEVAAGDMNCIGDDLSVIDATPNTFISDCYVDGGLPVVAKIKNTGTADVSNFAVSYQANGGAVVMETYNGTITPGQTIYHTFQTLFTPTGGLDAIDVTVSATNDADNANDTYTTYVQSYSSNAINLPYTQSFDGFTNCATSWDCDLDCSLSDGWYNVGNGVNEIGDDMDWRTHSGGTGTGSTGPSGDHTSGSGKYLYLETSSADGNGCRNSSASLQSPCIDLCQYNQASLSFWYHMYGSSIGSLHLDAFVDGNWQEDIMTPVEGAQGNQWIEANVDLSAYAGEVIILRFRGISGNGFRGDLALDDISITGNMVTASISCPAPATVTLDANCEATLADYTTSTSVTSVLANPTITQSPAVGTTITSTGVQSVTLTLEDACGVTADCSFNVTVEDDTNPSITCPSNQTLSMDANCETTVPDLVSSATASDNCTTVNITQVPAVGATISTLGTTTVTLTATDGSGNTADCSVSLTVEDDSNPSISCPGNQTINLDGNCEATIADMTNLATASDNCTSVSVSQSPNAGGALTTTGITTITMTATDGSGNTATCMFDLSALDVENPSISCPSDQTMSMDGNCEAVMPDMTSMTTASDNCTSISMDQMPPAGTIMTNNSSSTVTMTVTDGSGNTADCTFNVIVEDNTDPSITCPANQTANMDANCEVSITDMTGLATASDNCTSLSVTQSPEAGVVISTSGMTTIMMTATDGSGNTADCQFTLNVIDGTAPMANCEPSLDLEIPMEGTVSITTADVDMNSSDNCSAVSLSLSQSTFTCSDVGTMMVTMTVTDNSGNPSTCNTSVNITDPNSYCCAAASAVCQDATIEIDAMGNATVSVADVDGGSTAECGLQSISVSPENFDCSSVGTQTVTLSILDINGSSDNCTANVSVEDNIPPTISCANTTVTFDGETSIDVGIDDLYNAALSSDNCGTVNLVSPTSGFTIDCEDVGTMVTVVVEANDGNGNTQSCNATVTVEGLPCGWNNDGGIGCNSLLNEATYDANLDQYELTANSCTGNFPYVSDNVAFAYQELCGNGEIVAQVTNIDGDGIAGVMIRNTNDPGSSMAAAGTNFVDRLERQIRVLPNYPAYPQMSFSTNKQWVKIYRSGNLVQGFVSVDGMVWIPYFMQQVSLPNDCIVFGLYAYNKQPLSSVTATFNNVSVSNQNNTLADLPSNTLLEEEIDAPLDIHVFPNPVDEELTIDLHQFIGQELSIEVMNNFGQRVIETHYSLIEDTQSTIDVRTLSPGVYYLVINVNGQRMTKRIVVARK